MTVGNMIGNRDVEEGEEGEGGREGEEKGRRRGKEKLI